MIPPFLRERDVTWLVFGLLHGADEDLIRRKGTARTFDITGIEVSIDLDTPYWVPIWGRGWRLVSQVDAEECPVLYFQGDPERAREDLTVLRIVF